MGAREGETGGFGKRNGWCGRPPNPRQRTETEGKSHGIRNLKIHANIANGVHHERRERRETSRPFSRTLSRISCIRGGKNP